MTKFLYIADTHVGANPAGYQQQKAYPEKLPDILSALCKHVAQSGGVDFILHGGDMINLTTEDNVVAAVKAFSLPYPVYLCLGNHDLTTPDAVDLWLKLAPQFFVGGTPDYTLNTENCVIHISPNHWGDIPFFWSNTQNAHLSSSQVERLTHELNENPSLPHIIQTHSPVYGLPEGQTGFTSPYHSPDASFTEQVTSLAAKHPSVRCILGAHNHQNMCVTRGDVEYVTVSSLIETPFEAKLFEVCPERISMSTISLSDRLAFDSIYDTARSFVQGRAIDRSFARELSAFP